MESADKRPTLKTTKVGFRTLILYDSVLQALGIDPATEPTDRPKTITIDRTSKITGLSVRTINRMLDRARQAAPNKPPAPGAAEQAA